MIHWQIICTTCHFLPCSNDLLEFYLHFPVSHIVKHIKYFSNLHLINESQLHDHNSLFNLKCTALMHILIMNHGRIKAPRDTGISGITI